MDRIGKMLLTLAAVLGVAACGDVVSPDMASESGLFAVVSWTGDVTVSLDELGIASEAVQNNGKYALSRGAATAYWTANGAAYSQKLAIGEPAGDEETDGIDCEQEGEHEGDNEGCTFLLTFAGASLSITQVN